MDKLSKLISTLCPNGVEYRNLENVVKCYKGRQLNKTMLSENGKFPVINGGINPSGFWDEYNFPKDRITISQGGASAGYVNWQNTPFWAGAHCYVLMDENSDINYRFLYYVVKMYEKKLTECQYGAGIPALNIKEINSLQIPVPHIDIQNEIVRILDMFTELTAELTARNKQYEYYRNKLLTFKKLEN